MASTRAPHPIVWTILYIPFGALGGFITVALTFLGTRNGLSITETSFLNGAQLLMSWLKWLWAPIVDITLSPKRWYVVATVASALGVLTMAAMPLSPETLPLFLGVIAVASLINSVVGMAIEAMMAASTPPDRRGQVSAWFQAGNLGGAGVGGGLGLFLLEYTPEPWMAGAVLGTAFVACSAALLPLPDVLPHVGRGAVAAVRGVVGDLRDMVRTKGGLLAGILCALPVGTGAAQTVLTQAEVAAHWGAGSGDVQLLQGWLAGGINALGCFGGGWLCDRIRPRTAYAGIGALLAAVAVGMALSPATVGYYRLFVMTYNFTVGLAYAAFTAFALAAMGKGSGATKYNIFASLSNFPLWWLGLLLAWVAERSGAPAMLYTEAGLGVVGVFLFGWAVSRVGRSRLPEELTAG